MIESVEESLSENADEKAKKRILKIVSQAGSKGVTRNELTRKTQFIRRSFREEYVQDLIDANEITVRDVISGRNHCETLFLTGFAPNNAN